MNDSVRAKVEEFFAAYPARTWPKGQIIIHAGDEPRGVFFIEKGAIRQYSISNGGEEVVVNITQYPAFIPMSWALGKVPNSYFFETVGESVLRCAPRDEVLAFIKENPDVVFDLLHRLYVGLDGVLMRMVHLMSGTAYVRVMHELVIHAQRNQTANSFEPINEYNLGKYSGLARETVSREIRKLKKKDLVGVSKSGVTVTDLTALEQELKDHL